MSTYKLAELAKHIECLVNCLNFFSQTGRTPEKITRNGKPEQKQLKEKKMTTFLSAQNSTSLEDGLQLSQLY